MYEPLEIASPINGTYTPFLATGYKFTGPKTLVYTIRQGVKWSDGKPFTPADVVFTFQLLKKNPALDSNGVWAQVADVVATGNIGCLTQLAGGMDIPTAHTVELLDWAYGGPMPRGLEALAKHVQNVPEATPLVAVT